MGDIILSVFILIHKKIKKFSLINILIYFFIIIIFIYKKNKVQLIIIIYIYKKKRIKMQDFQEKNNCL